MHWDANKLFKLLPLYNTFNTLYNTLYNTFIERPSVKKLSNVELLKKLPFYDELSKTALVKQNSVVMPKVIKVLIKEM